MEAAGYLLHGAVHSGNPLVELLLSLLPVALIVGGIGTYLLAACGGRDARRTDGGSDEPV